MKRIIKKRKELIFYLIRDAVQNEHSYNPNNLMLYFEEELYPEEFKEIESFLNWVNKNNYSFGSNISQVYDKYCVDMIK